MAVFENLFDGRFNFKEYNKPFFDDSNKNYEIMKLIKENIKNDFDLINSCRVYNVPNLSKKKYFNEPIEKDMNDNKKLIGDVNKYLLRIKDLFKLEDVVIPEVNENDENNEQDEQEQNNEENDDEQNEQDEQNNELNDGQIDNSILTGSIIPHDSVKLQPNETDMKYSSLSDIAPYNLLSGKVLSFNDVCMMTLNIARTQLMVVVTKDENIIFMEEREKQKLQQELNKYIQNNNIKKMFVNVDINQLNLKQLQYYTNQCKDTFESLKVMDIAQHGLELFDLGYKSVFPNGIKIKNKRVKLDNTLNAFNEILFDRNSTAGISFKNVINKYNIHVSDELNTALSLLGKMAKHITVETIPENELDKSGSEEEKVEKKGEEKEKNDKLGSDKSGSDKSESDKSGSENDEKEETEETEESDEDESETEDED